MGSDFTRKWIIETGIPIVQSYDGNLTLRALHYRLVAAGMTNDLGHYKKVVSAMTKARWDGLIGFDAFMDHERESLGWTAFEPTDVDSAAEMAKDQIKEWANQYSKNRWENQPNYVEVFIEKKALIGVFDRVCRDWDVALNPCKGYPSLTFQWDAVKRYRRAIRQGKHPVIIYFGDYDCSGEDIPRSLQETLERMGTSVDLIRIALTEEQVVEWKLPPAPTKTGDSRAAAWDGIGQVELDAVEPSQIVGLCETALQSVFDSHLYDELLEQEVDEKQEFQDILRRDFETLLD